MYFTRPVSQIRTHLFEPFWIFWGKAKMWGCFWRKAPKAPPHLHTVSGTPDKPQDYFSKPMKVLVKLDFNS